jgi:hypothetical protein
MSEPLSFGPVNPVPPSVNASVLTRQEMSGWKRHRVSILFGLGIALVLMVTAVLSRIEHRVREGYALWAVSEMVVASHWHQSRWPRSWLDLEEVVGLSRYVTGGQTVEDLREMVEVDFERLADWVPVVEDQDAGGMRVPVIRLRSGRRGIWVQGDDVLAAYWEDPAGYCRLFFAPEE